MTLLMYHSGTYFGRYKNISFHNSLTYLTLGLFVMSVLALRSLHAKPEVIVIAFLWNPFPISGWFLLMSLLEISVHLIVRGLKKQFRILTILHSLIHEK